MYSGEIFDDLGTQSLIKAQDRIKELEEQLRVKDKQIALLNEEIEQKKIDSNDSKAEVFRSYTRLLNNINSIVLVFSVPEGKILFANPKAVSFYGYSAEELVNLNINQLNTMPPENINEEIKNVINKKYQYFLFPHRLKSGEIRNVEVYSSSINFDGKDYILSLIHDATQRVKSEESYLNSLRRNQALLNALPDVVFVVDKDGFYTDYKADLLNRRGMSKEMIIGKHLNEIGFTEESMKKIIQAHKNVLNGGKPEQFNCELITSKGKKVYYHSRVALLNENEVMGVSRDITEEVQKENKLHQAQKRNTALFNEISHRFNVEKNLLTRDNLFTAITNSTPHAIYVIDTRTNDILFYNDLFCRIWGLEDIESHIRSGEIKHNDLLTYCMMQADDIPQYVRLMTSDNIESENGYCIQERIRLVDKRVLSFFSTTIYNNQGYDIGRLYMFEQLK